MAMLGASAIPGQPGVDSLEDEPTITEIMKNPSKVNIAYFIIINFYTACIIHCMVNKDTVGAFPRAVYDD